MGKSHLNRLTAPKTWDIARKHRTFVTRTMPGPHRLENALPVTVILRDVLKLCRNLKEVKYALRNGKILIDGKVRKDHKHAVGLMDTFEVPDADVHMRVAFGKNGKIGLFPLAKGEEKYKISKITSKCTYKGKVMITTHDGRNVVVEQTTPYKIGDSLKIALPDGKAAGHIAMENGAIVYLIGGKHRGNTGTIEKVERNTITFKNEDNEVFQTLKDYAFVVGKDKQLITFAD